MLDRVFAEAGDGVLPFHPAPPPTDEEVARLLATALRPAKQRRAAAVLVAESCVAKFHTGEASATATLAGALSSLGYGISSANPTPNATFNTTRPGWQNHVFLHSGNGHVTLAFSFATPINAFGAYITGLDNAGLLSVTFDDGVPFTTTISGPAANLETQFLGITDFGKSFSSATFTLPTAFYGVESTTWSIRGFPRQCP